MGRLVRISTWAGRRITTQRRSVVGVRPPCAPKGARSERRGALHDARGCACALRAPPGTSSYVAGYAELQSKHRAAYGDNEAAREAAGKAALLRAK